MADLIRFEADRARQWYATGMQLMPLLDRRSAACTGAMAGIYRRLLEHISASPQTALASRMSLSGREKAMIAAAALAGLGRAGRSPACALEAGHDPGPDRTPGCCDRRRAGRHHGRAIGLRDAGVAVTLLESRPRLGGAATSYARAGMMIDNGQHVFLRCCDHYQALLARLGVTGSVAIQDRFDVTVLSARRGIGQAAPRRAAEPAAPGQGTGQVPACCRWASGPRSAVPPWPSGSPIRPARTWTASASAAGWRPAARDERARRRLWDLFIISALNIDGDEASVGLAATVIKTALLGARDAADIGMAKVPLGQPACRCDGWPAGTASARRCGSGARATSIERLAGGGFGVLAWEPRPRTALRLRPSGAVTAGGRRRASSSADGCAGPAIRLPGWPDPPGSRRPPPGEASATSPIVNVHVIYDRQVMDLPFAAAVDSPVQWVFDKTRQAGVAIGPVPRGIGVGCRRSRRRAHGRCSGGSSCLRSSELFPAAAGRASRISS